MPERRRRCSPLRARVRARLGGAARGAGLAIAAAAAALSACTGLFQGQLPDHAATYHARGDGGPLLVGAGEADITPRDEQYLGGFSLNRIAEGVHLPLKARALVCELGGQRIAIVGVDNLGLQRDDVEWIKSGLAGFPNGNVWLCSSHTHAAPDLVGLWGHYLLTSGRDRGYLVRVRDGVVAAVAQAAAAVRPARLVRAEAWLPPEGLVKNSNRPGVFNRRATVLQAYDATSGAPFAALLHVVCHPEVMRRKNTLVSPDFVGPLCDLWKAAGLGQAVFVNGELGAMVTPDVRAATIDVVDKVHYTGELLFELLRGALRSAREVPVAALEVRRRDVYLPVAAFGLRLARLTLAIPRTMYGGRLRTSVGWLRIGDVEIAAVPGEMEPGLAARIRGETLRPDLLFFGLCDDEVGYLMAERDARDELFAYERSMSPSPDSGERVRRALTGVPDRE